MEKLFFDNWESTFRIIISSIVAYVSLIILLRISGKRTLSKMNAFDLIITIALGSTLATVILSKDVALMDGILVFALLIIFQYVITFLSVRFTGISKLVKSTPALIAYKGELLKKVMLKERVNEDEIFAIIREKGFSSLKDTEAIVLETDGSLTVIEKVNASSRVMTSLKNFPIVK